MKNPNESTSIAATQTSIDWDVFSRCAHPLQVHFEYYFSVENTNKKIKKVRQRNFHKILRNTFYSNKTNPDALRNCKNSHELFMGLVLDERSTLVWKTVSELYFAPKNEQKLLAFKQSVVSAQGSLTDDEMALAKELQLSRAAYLESQALIKQQEKIARQLQAQRQAEEARLRRLEEEERRQKKLLADQEKLVAEACARCMTGIVTLSEFESLAKRHLLLFNVRLTLPRAQKQFGLTSDNKKSIEAEQSEIDARNAVAREIAKQAAAKARAERERIKTFIFTTDVPQYLNITKTEYKRWMDEGKLVPTMMREFSKWGKTLEAPLFDPDYLKTITPEKISTWRSIKDATIAANRSLGAKKGAAKAQKTRAIKTDLALHDYANEFPAARCLVRNFEICTGPTNSGKTHYAMQSLAKAPTGVYLAPLRLLALENYERLKSLGVLVDLITGEERITTPGATHVCMTVEMCDFKREFDVAVIDEIQMIGDPQRGSAWVAAVLGVPARTVYACGAYHGAYAVEQLLTQTKDTHKETPFKRINPLIVESSPVGLHSIAEGDALIAFSRAEVLQYAQLLKQRGLRVAAIYGALSPEVRRKQAQAFAQGDAQVVVATDCIGMGLNLPIRRVVFSTIRKYNGESMVTLSNGEIQQIAGRAGRFGQHEQGFVSAFNHADLNHIRNKIDIPTAPFTPPFAITPTLQHIQTILAHHKSNDVSHAFTVFEKLNFSGMFKQGSLEDARSRLTYCKQLSIYDAFTLANAPIDTEKHNDLGMLNHFVTILMTDDEHLIFKEPRLDFANPSADQLSEAESYSRSLSIFSWFATKYPHKANSDKLAKIRAELADFIDRCLVANISTFVAKKKKKHHWNDWDV